MLGALSLKAGSRLLDIGCGRGGLIVFMLHHNPEVEAIGLERDPRRAAEARKSTGTNIIRGDGRELPFSADTMDTVILAKSLHHMSPEVRSRTLRESRRVLKPHGKLLVLERAAPRNILERAGMYVQVALGGEDREVYSLFKRGLIQELEAASFEVVEDVRKEKTRLTLAIPLSQ